MEKQTQPNASHFSTYARVEYRCTSSGIYGKYNHPYPQNFPQICKLRSFGPTETRNIFDEALNEIFCGYFRHTDLSFQNKIQVSILTQNIIQAWGRNNLWLTWWLRWRFLGREAQAKETSANLEWFFGAKEKGIFIALASVFASIFPFSICSNHACAHRQCVTHA